MATQSIQLYTRIVTFAKIFLPLVALAILSSLFLFSKTNDPGKGVRLFDGDLNEFASKERIIAPRFAGMTPAGIAIQISAQEAGPRESGGPAFDATDLVARIEMPDGNIIDVIAPHGSIDSFTNMSELTGGILLKTSGGYYAKTQGLTFALNTVDIRSLGEISAKTPIGDMQAGAMTLSLAKPTSANEDPSYDLVFKNGIKLIYKPSITRAGD